jgi:hypothetical protein
MEEEEEEDEEYEANSLSLPITDPETYCTFMTTQLLYS